MTKTLLYNGHIIDPTCGFNRIGAVAIADGLIVALGESLQDFEAERKIDVKGRLIIPGIVDLCARLREPGQEHKATLASETQAAAASGITTLVCPPDTDPPIDSPAQIELITHLAQQASGVRVQVLGALTAGLAGKQLAEMAALKRAKAVGLSQALQPMSSHVLARRALEYAASHDMTVFLHPIDWSLSGQGCVHEGFISTRMGLPGIPQAAETAALGVILALVEQTKARVHICRLSTARGADMVARARRDGLAVTADVSMHQLFLTQNDVNDFNSLCHVIPPLRTLEDRAGLRAAVADGVINAICSDHQPHDADAKLAPFPSTQPGISALETLLPLGLRLVDEGVLSLYELVRRIAEAPGVIIRQPLGSLSVGRPADVCVVDTTMPYTPTPQNWRSQGLNTPFFGWNLQGVVTQTFVAGRLIYDNEY